MKNSFHLGTVGGVSIDINWSVVVITALLTWSLGAQLLVDAAPDYPAAAYWTTAALGAIALMGSVLLHELAHALVAKRLGVEVDGITLWMFGGVSKLGGHATTAQTELRIAIVGPAASLATSVVALVAAVVVAIAGGPKLLIAVLGWLALVNVTLAVFNMLPGAPLDGGRVLAAVLWHRWGDEHRARIKAAETGRMLGQVLVGIGIVEFALVGVGGLWLALIGWFLTTSARAEATSEHLVDALGGLRVADIMSRNVQTASARWTIDQFVRDHAMTSPISSFPVVDDAGAVIGLVTLRGIRGVAVARWPTSTLGQIAVPIEHLNVAAPGERLIDVLQRANRGGTDAPSQAARSQAARSQVARSQVARSQVDGRILVVDAGDLVGIVTPTDVNRVIERVDLARAARSPS